MQIASRRTLICSLCALLFTAVALLVCEVRARIHFAENRVLMDYVVTRALAEVHREVKESWCHDARLNPSYAAFVENYPQAFSVVGSFIENDESRVNDY